MSAPPAPRPLRFRIRSRLLLAHAFLVLVPLLGLSFARIHERELLRSEEEGLVALGAALSAGLSVEAGEPQPVQPPLAAPAPIDELKRVPAASQAAAHEAARRLRARVRILGRAGQVLLDTGPEQIRVLTRGRQFLGRDDAPRRLVVGDPEPVGDLRDRPEVARALAGQRGRASRTEAQLRGVRLYLAEPVRGAAGTLGAVYVSRTTYPVLVSLYRIRNGLYRVALASLGVALVLAVFLGLTISRPLRRLTEAAQRIAGGERGVALSGLGQYQSALVSGRDEIGELSRAFEAMARELDARLSYLSEWAANVSHEFKTPIASIRGAAELLRDGAADDPVALVRFLSNIQADCDRLSRLVSRLLELSRIEAQREPAVPLDYRALIEEVVQRQEATDPGRVVLTYAARHAHLRGSAEQLASVLTNLLDNALRFSPPGGPGQLAVRVVVQDDEGGALRTEVQDQGQGISEANLQRVWDRFFTTARGQGGTGLGLAIVRAVVEQHGGRVGAQSQPGAGSTFYFVLPRRL